MNGRWRVMTLVAVVLAEGVIGCASGGGGGDDDDGDGPNGTSWSADRTRCERICAELQAAGCSNYDHGLCVNQCVDADDFLKETTECQSDYRSFMSCVEIQNPVCLALPDPNSPETPPCYDESVDWAECVVDYCADNPSKDWCS